MRPWFVFTFTLAVLLALFLLAVGLDTHSLPFPPESDYSDAVTSHWPNALFLRRSVLDNHTWPLWRPLIMSGQPFAANPLSKVWYPPQWLVFVLPPILHLNLLIWLHLVAAGTGAWAWGRLTGLAPWPAALAGIGYAFAPRLIASVGAGHLDLIYAAAWVPWLLWAVEQIVQPVPARRAALWLGIFAALCLLADVRLSAYAFALTVAYLAWKCWQTPALRSRRMLRRVGVLVGTAALLTAGLTAVQWVPLLLIWDDLSRASISLNDAALDSLKAGQWVGLLIGDHGGSWETLVYVGVSTLILAIAALLRQPGRFAFWGAALLFIALYAMGNQFVLWTALVRLVPPLRWWRVPPRVWLLAALIWPYLAAWGVQLLAGQPTTQRAARLAVVGLVGGGLICGIFSNLMLAPPLARTAVIGLFALPVAALVMLLAIFGQLAPRALAIVFTVIVAADVLWIDRTLVEGRAQKEWLDPHRALAEYLVQDKAVRVYSPSYSLPQQAAAYWSIPQFDGVDPFQLADYVDAAETATGVRADGYSVTIPAYEVEAEGDLSTANRAAPINPALLGQWLVTHVVAAFEIDAAGLELAAQIGDVYVYRNTAAPPVTLTWDGPNRVTVQAAEPIAGVLYAVPRARWQGQGQPSPGLPGEVNGTVQTWTFEYSRSEIWLSLLPAGILIALAAGWWEINRG